MHSAYKNQSYIGKSFHCLEHLVEVTILLFKIYNFQKKSKQNDALIEQNEGFKINLSIKPFSIKDKPILTKSDCLQMAAAAILHNYDPERQSGPPQLNRTLQAIQDQPDIRNVLKNLNVDMEELLLLIERIVSPYAMEKNQDWNEKIKNYFTNDSGLKKFIQKTEFLNLIDKAALYYLLPNTEICKRIQALESELSLPSETLLSKTKDYLNEKNIEKVKDWLPQPYPQKWEELINYFSNRNKEVPQAI